MSLFRYEQLAGAVEGDRDVQIVVLFFQILGGGFFYKKVDLFVELQRW